MLFTENFIILRRKLEREMQGGELKFRYSALCPVTVRELVVQTFRDLVGFKCLDLSIVSCKCDFKEREWEGRGGEAEGRRRKEEKHE